MNLEEIRERIDVCDDEIVAALGARFALIEEVRQAKRASGQDDAIIRPGREATILKRILSKSNGVVPPILLARMWREIVSVAALQQGDISVAVCAPGTSVGFWDLARNHFGAAMPMSLHRSTGTVMRRVMDVEGVIGILPWPEEGEEAPWWLGLSLAPLSETPPRVIWRLPFFKSNSGQFEDVRAFAVAHAVAEETGDDASLVVVETDFDTSRASVTRQFGDLGGSVQIIATHEDPGAGSRYLLLEIDAFLDNDDSRLHGVSDRMGKNLLRLRVIGNYPAAIHMQDNTR